MKKMVDVKKRVPSPNIDYPPVVWLASALGCLLL